MNTTTVSISGMTCGHCVASVTEELSGVESVENVDVTLNKGGLSTAVITASKELDKSQISEAVAEAGYQVASNNA